MTDNIRIHFDSNGRRGLRSDRHHTMAYFL